MAKTERDFVLVLDAVAAILSARGVNDGVAHMAYLKNKAGFRAPECSREGWVELLTYINAAAREGHLPNPTAPDAPAWSKWLSDVIEARVLLVRP